MSKSNDNLIWLDMEMTGLNSETDKILEIAVIITDPFLKILAEGPVLVLKQSDDALSKMDSWNQSTHGKSGLIEKVKKLHSYETPCILKIKVDEGYKPFLEWVHASCETT